MNRSSEVDAYIAAAPKAAQPHLRRLRALIGSEAPDAEEGISYRMPSYTYRGKLMYFAAFKNHVGLFPVGNADKHLEMKEYMTGKGTYRFPLEEPLPDERIRRLVRTRVKENDQKAAARSGSSRPAASNRSATQASARGSRRASR